jgi:hypothetical protein
VFLGRPEDAFEIIAAACEATSDPRILGLIGAGDLENLLRAYFLDFVDRIAAIAPTSPGLCEALGSVWLEGPDEIQIHDLLDRIALDEEST